MCAAENLGQPPISTEQGKTRRRSDLLDDDGLPRVLASLHRNGEVRWIFLVVERPQDDRLYVIRQSESKSGRDREAGRQRKHRENTNCSNGIFTTERATCVKDHTKIGTTPDLMDALEMRESQLWDRVEVVDDHRDVGVKLRQGSQEKYERAVVILASTSHEDCLHWG